MHHTFDRVVGGKMNKILVLGSHFQNILYASNRSHRNAGPYLSKSGILFIPFQAVCVLNRYALRGV